MKGCSSASPLRMRAGLRSGRDISIYRDAMRKPAFETPAIFIPKSELLE